MKAALHHMQINVREGGRSFPFYRDLLEFLGFRVVAEGGSYVGFTDGGLYLWLVEVGEEFKEARFNRHHPGLNHLAFKVESRGRVDAFRREFLAKQELSAIYGEPTRLVEYREDYYGVVFEDPDGLRLEVVAEQGAVV